MSTSKPSHSDSPLDPHAAVSCQTEEDRKGSTAASNIRTVGNDSSVASIKFTGIINTADDSLSSEDECSGSPITMQTGIHDDIKAVDVDTPVACVKFTGLISNDNNSSSSLEEDALHPDVNKGVVQISTSQSAGCLLENVTSGGQERFPVSSALMDQIHSDPLSVREDHFSTPEGETGGPKTIAELQMAIEKCKLLVQQTTPHTDNARNLIRKLVQLRLKLHEAKEGPTVDDESVMVVMGHSFKERPWGSAKGYCERCNAMIIGIVQAWLKCTVCGFCCHKRCLNLIKRTCAGLKVMDNPTYILDICPVKGLHVQNYRCAECRTPIGFQTGMSEARLCDYNGLYYCDHCHWNDTMVILARVLSNWDFKPRKICRASKQILKLTTRKAIIRVQDINPMLFSYLEELNQVKKLREEILIMKKYFLLCDEALKSRILCQLQERQHFVENSDMYSVQDLIDLANDVLLPELTKIHASFAQHIKTDCAVCRDKGCLCLICSDVDILFPFDNCAFVCPNCSNVVHRHCYISRNQRCPKCQRNPASSAKTL